MTTGLMTFMGKPWPKNDQREESFGSVPSGYQRKSEGYLGRTSGLIGRQAGVGDELLSTGRGLISRWAPRSETAYDAASGYANRSPQYDVDRAAIESNRSFDESRAILGRTMERMGINPNSGRFAGLQSKWGLARAAAEAGAKTRARNQAEDTAFLRLMNMVQTGNQGVGQGAGLMSGAGSQFASAGQGYRGLAGAYDTLATDSARLEENQKREAIGLPPLSQTQGLLQETTEPDLSHTRYPLEEAAAVGEDGGGFDIWNV